jgi:hypothetical protein
MKSLGSQMLKCTKCKQDYPFAEGVAASFVCYECKMMHSWANADNKPVVATPRPQVAAFIKMNGKSLLPGSRVHRIKDGYKELYIVEAVKLTHFICGAYSPNYHGHCVKGVADVYWCHEDGTPIIAPQPMP